MVVPEYCTIFRQQMLRFPVPTINALWHIIPAAIRTSWAVDRLEFAGAFLTERYVLCKCEDACPSRTSFNLVMTDLTIRRRCSSPNARVDSLMESIAGFL